MKLAVSLLSLATACGVSQQPSLQDDTASDDTSAVPSPPGADGGGGQFRYRLVPLPLGVPNGIADAGKLVCAGSTVVGFHSTIDGGRAFVFDYRTEQIVEVGARSASVGRDGNASGAFVGSVGNQAFVQRDGVMTQLPGIGGNENGAYAINASGQIVGQGQIPGSGDVDQHAILWEPGCSNAIDLGTLDAGYSYARAINDAGVIVGAANVGDGVNTHAVMWGTDHVIVDLGTGGAMNAQAMDINASGLIAGFANNQPVLIDNGAFVTLGSTSGFALALNDRGDVVGAASSGAGAHAYLWESGTEVDLNSEVDANGWVLQSAVDICDNGVIAGNGVFNNASRGFVLIPNP